ncbi:hypothetical protein SEUCBS140593_002213 [Sporothrix eucalyptigena]|uniref:Hypersensitive response-inducing protein n=1 Tax=Sporothrix eucalyptigena TaxID=1812306 RepID=A0ABP0B4T7_9PEZI
MKFLALLALATSVSAIAIEPRHHAGKKTKHTKTAVAAAASATSSAVAAAATAATAVSAAADTNDVADGQTIVLFEVNGVPGNECLTFRNNGEIVDAACVDDSSDRQITPDTINGQSVLRVQRTFTADFRPDLVGVQACIGFNGTDFKAVDCNGAQPVVFTGGELRTSDGAVCASGHDDIAQLTIDTTGTTCATYTVTDVTAAST